MKLIEAEIFLTPQATAKLEEEMDIFRRHYPDGLNFRCRITPYDRPEIVSDRPCTAFTLTADLKEAGRQTQVMRVVRVGPAFWEKTVRFGLDR